MKSLLSIILLVCTSFTLFGGVLDSASTRKFRVGLSYSADYCYRSLSTDPAYEWLVGLRNDLESPKLGFTTGLVINRRLNEKLSLESGLLYSNKGEKIKEIVFTNIVGEVTGSASVTYSYNYIDVPVAVNFVFRNEKVKMFMSGGISVNVFLSYKSVTSIENNDGSSDKSSSSSNDEFKPINFAALAGLGVEFGVSNKMDLRIQSIYRHSVTSVIDTPIKQFPYSFGLNIVLLY